MARSRAASNAGDEAAAMVVDDDDGAARIGTSDLFFCRSSRSVVGPAGDCAVASLLEGCGGGAGLFFGFGAALGLPSLERSAFQFDMLRGATCRVSRPRRRREH